VDIIYLVMSLALVQFMAFGILVGRARGQYGVNAPATTGHPVFERYFRVQQNTLELLVVFLPALPLYAHYVDIRSAAGLGAVYLIGRFVFLRAYVSEPKSRSLGFALSMLPTVILLVGGLLGAARAVLASAH
jgi:glutathione S-transferase